MTTNTAKKRKIANAVNQADRPKGTKERVNIPLKLRVTLQSEPMDSIRAARLNSQGKPGKVSKSDLWTRYTVSYKEDCGTQVDRDDQDQETKYGNNNKANAPQTFVNFYDSQGFHGEGPNPFPSLDALCARAEQACEPEPRFADFRRHSDEVRAAFRELSHRGPGCEAIITGHLYQKETWNGRKTGSAHIDEIEIVAAKPVTPGVLRF